MNSVQTIDSFVIHVCSVPTNDVSKWCWVTVYCASMFKTPRSARVHGGKEVPYHSPTTPFDDKWRREGNGQSYLLACFICLHCREFGLSYYKDPSRRRKNCSFRSSRFKSLLWLYWLHALIWIEFLRMPFTDWLLIRNSKVIRTLCLRKMGADKITCADESYGRIDGVK